MTLAFPIDHILFATAHYTARPVSLDDHFVSDIARSSASVFATPEFLGALFDTISRANAADTLLIGVSDTEGQPVALFPFTLRSFGGLRRLEGLGFGVADYYTPVLARPADPDALWRAVLRALPRADLLRLYNVPQELYGQGNALTGALFLRPMGHGSTILPLRDGGKPVDPEHFSAARDVRRKLKKLAALGTVNFYRAETAVEKAKLIAALIRFRQERFDKLQRKDKLTEPGVTEFYQRLLREGVAEIWGLEVDGDVASVVYGLRHQGVFTLIIPTMTTAPRYEAGSPGLVAVFKTICKCIREGDSVFDFSLGALHYKTRFGAEKLELYEYVQARSLHGLVPAWIARARSMARVWRQRHPHAEAIWGLLKTNLKSLARR